jgi:DedD protein
MNDKMNLSQPKLASPGSLPSPAGRPVNRAVRAVAIAVAVVLALLGGLAAYEAYNRDAPAPTRSEPPAQQAAAEPPAPPAPEPAAAPQAEPAPAPGPEADRAAAPEPSRLAEGGAAKPAAEPRRRATEKAQGSAMTSTTTVGPLAPQPDTRAAGVPGAWFVQAGVFNNLANAEAMRDRLAANGFPTLLEIRVLAGPYPDRGEAQQAQRKLGELGVAPTILVPARKTAAPPAGR